MENITESICPKCWNDLSNLDRLHFGMCSKCFAYYCTKNDSGSVAAPKEDEISNLMVYKIQAYEQLAELASLRQQLETLRGFVKEVDASLYHGSDLEDKEIMQHYIEVFKIIKEEARNLLSK